MTNKNNSSYNLEYQGNGTEYEKLFITSSYNLDSALLNLSPDFSDTFTTSLPTTNFDVVAVKMINSFEGYRQKLTKPRKSPYSRLGWWFSDGSYYPQIDFNENCEYPFGSPFCDTCSIQKQCPNHDNKPIESNLMKIRSVFEIAPFMEGDTDDTDTA